MATRPGRPYSARPYLESTKPLNTSPPLSRLLARSHSQSTEEARRYHNSIARAQALDDSAKSHSSPSKTPRLKQQHMQPETPSSGDRGMMSSASATLLAVMVLLFWQILVTVVLCLALHSSKQISKHIAEQGKGWRNAVVCSAVVRTEHVYHEDMQMQQDIALFLATLHAEILCAHT